MSFVLFFPLRIPTYLLKAQLSDISTLLLPPFPCGGVTCEVSPYTFHPETLHMGVNGYIRLPLVPGSHCQKGEKKTPSTVVNKIYYIT